MDWRTLVFYPEPEAEYNTEYINCPLNKTESCINLTSLCHNFFHLLASKAKSRKIQTNSFIIFTCPNPVLLVLGFDRILYQLNLILSLNVGNFC